MMHLRNLLFTKKVMHFHVASVASKFCLTSQLKVYRSLKQRLSASNTSSVSIFSKLIAERRPAFKAVIFDKDGTLVCFHSLWIPWARHIATSVSEAVDMDVSEEIYALLGVCSKTSRIRPGLLAEGTKTQIGDAVAQLLLNHGVDRDLAISVSSRHVSYWSASPKHLNELHDLKDLFTVLRQHGILIGICTSDSREGTMKSLTQLDVLHLIDLVVCGDDPDTRPKPDPHNAQLIFNKLDIKPEEAVMVGDTPTDILFAKNGQFGLSVGVLTGIGKREDLEQAWYNSRASRDTETETDFKAAFQIIPSVADIIPLVLPDSSIPIETMVETTLSGPLSSVEGDPSLRLVILDKDGSLTNVHPRWSTWTEKLCSKLIKKTSPYIANQFLDILGYSPEIRKSTGGLLVDSSNLHIKECLNNLLMLNGYGLENSPQLLEEIWFDPEHDSTDLVPGVVDAVRELKEKGMRIAINSSDSRDACQAFLNFSKLGDCIDLVSSAEDADRHPKPLPHTVHRIMEKLECLPQQTMVVGDSPADLMSGRAAGVRLIVGVLSGFSSAHNLLPYANILVPNATYLPHLVRLDSGQPDSVSK